MKYLKLLLPLITLFICGFIYFGGKGDGLTSYTIDIDVAPVSSAIFLDGAEISPGLHEIKNDATISARKEGFAEYKKTIKIVNLVKDKSLYVGIVLDSNSPSTKDWYNNRPEDQDKSSAISSRIFDERSKSVENKYAFIDRLPSGGQRFEIAYGKTRETRTDRYPDSLAIYITGSGVVGRNEALQSLNTDIGVKPESIEIIFDNITNPFQGEDPRDENQ